jgi:predicted MFS family arabinose efflux permease
MEIKSNPEAHSVISKRAVFAASTISASGSAIFLIMPLLIGVASEDLGLSKKDAGFVASSYFGGYLLICLSLVLWIQKVHWQLVTLSGYSLLISGLLLSVLSENYSFILLAFFIAGCGGGILFGLCLCIIAETDNPDRYFGVKLCAEQLLAVALLFILPLYVTNTWGFTGMAVCLSVVFMLLAFFAFWMPPRGNRSTTKNSKTNSNYSTRAVWLSLFCLMIFMIGISGVWAFVERMANDNSIDAIEIGRALSFGVIGGGLGGFIAALIGNKFGRKIPLLLSVSILSTAFIVLNSDFSSFTFTLTCIALSGLWNYSLAYQMGIVADLDISGRLTVMMPSALALGAMLGPAIAGLVIMGKDYLYVHLIAFTCILFATLVFIPLSQNIEVQSETLSS